MRRVAVLGLLLVTACGSEPSTQTPQPGNASLKVSPPIYASELVQFEPGPGAGFGQDDLPGVVLGGPRPGASGAGSLDVLSLGAGGWIVLGFGGRSITDGPGPDFVVFENAFEVANSPGQVYAELGLVSVSTDAVTWHDFTCNPGGFGEDEWQGCAGWNPTSPYDVENMEPLDADATGGDAFDLLDLGLSAVSFVRIKDLGEDNTAPTAGFDLDAIGAVHLR